MRSDGVCPVDKNEGILKSALGTAQLGQIYGIANQTGKPAQTDALRILEYAMSRGIDTIDTAPGYGESEDIIGRFIEERNQEVLNIPRIITKIPSQNQCNPVMSEDVNNNLFNSIKSSLKRLKLDAVDVCLLHDPADLTSFNGRVVSSLINIKREGLVKQIGVSVYSPEEVQKAIDLDCFDIVEVPINILDHRLIREGLLNQLSDLKIKVYARSVFLQGLLFFNPDNLPEELKMAKAPLEKLKLLSLDSGLKPHQLSLLFVRDLVGIDKVVIGCETLEQLKDNINIIDLPRLEEGLSKKIASYFSDISENIIDPTKWRRRKN